MESVLHLFVGLAAACLWLPWAAAQQDVWLLSICSGDVKVGGLGNKSKPLVDLALSEINNRTDILNGYELKVEHVDSDCDPVEGSFRVTKALKEGPPKVGIMGPCYSPVCEVVSPVARSYNLVIKAASCVIGEFSDEEKYPLFTRIFPPTGEMVVYAMVQLAGMFKWGRFTFVTQDIEICLLLAGGVHQTLAATFPNFDHVATLLMATHDDAYNVVAELPSYRPRILVLSAYEDFAVNFFCALYQAGMYGPSSNLVMLSPTHWWNSNFIEELVMVTTAPLQKYLRVPAIS